MFVLNDLSHWIAGVTLDDWLDESNLLMLDPAVSSGDWHKFALGLAHVCFLFSYSNVIYLASDELAALLDVLDL